MTLVKAWPLLSFDACWTAFCASVIARLKPGSGSLTGVTVAGVPHAARIAAQAPSSAMRRADLRFLVLSVMDTTIRIGRSREMLYPRSTRIRRAQPLGCDAGNA